MTECMRSEAIEPDLRGRLVETLRIERCATSSEHPLLAAEHEIAGRPAGDVNGQLVDEEPRHRNLSSLVVLRIARHDMAIDHEVRLIDARRRIKSSRLTRRRASSPHRKPV